MIFASLLKKLNAKIPHHYKGLIYISVTALIWSSGGLFIKLLPLDPFKIAGYRSFIAGITVLLISSFYYKQTKFDTDIKSNLAVVFYAGILILFVIATKMTTAANAIFLQFTAPIYLLIMEPLFLKTKFDFRSLGTIIVTLFGMALFFFGRLETGDILGNILAIISGICFASFTLLIKWKKMSGKNTNDLNVVVAGNFLVALICLPIVLPDLSLSFSETIILIYMGMVQIGISYVIFNEGVKYVSATESMIIATMEAVFNPIWVYLGIGEKPSGYAIIGGVIILSAILWRNLKKNLPHLSPTAK